MKRWSLVQVVKNIDRHNDTVRLLSSVYRFDGDS